ncbi:MAG: outer membrane lipoprotein carrier protein LolA [Bryobacteraceae bacterium]
MRRTAVGAILVAMPMLAADADISHLINQIEVRYNRARTLEVGFSESYGFPGRAQRTETGELYLRKPGRMRWQYTEPAGKLFVSDGKLIYSYSPNTGRAEKTKLKETEDMRAPLAFLLGRLEFRKDFRSFDAKPDGANTFITAQPKSDRFPYKQVAFLVTPEAEIRRLVVTLQDSSVLEFNFDDEKVNPALSGKLFEFTPPPGVETVDLTGER